MSDSSCPRCAELQQPIEQLQAQVRDLSARFNVHGGNSSLPPSANPPSAPKPTKKKKSKRKQGGQPGHPPKLKQLLPKDQVTNFEPIVPTHCLKCQTPLPESGQPQDPEPKRFQVFELPPIVLEVTEYQAHTRECPCCQHLNEATIPADVREHSVGPRLTATLSYLAGCHGVSKRGVEEIDVNVIGARISLGTVSNLEGRTSQALAQAHAEVQKAVQDADVKHADETSWKVRGKLCWLLGRGHNQLRCVLIDMTRSAAGLAAILGQEIHGLVHCDRYSVYHKIPAHQRQVCWAHRKRDFRKIAESGSPGERIGQRSCVWSKRSLPRGISSEKEKSRGNNSKR